MLFKHNVFITKIKTYQKHISDVVKTTFNQSRYQFEAFTPDKRSSCEDCLVGKFLTMWHGKRFLPSYLEYIFVLAEILSQQKKIKWHNFFTFKYGYNLVSCHHYECDIQCSPLMWDQKIKQTQPELSKLEQCSHYIIWIPWLDFYVYQL